MYTRSKMTHFGARSQIPACVGLRAKNFASYGSEKAAGRAVAATPRRCATCLAISGNNFVVNCVTGWRLRVFSVAPFRFFSPAPLHEPGNPLSCFLNAFRRARRCELASLSSSFDPPATRGPDVILIDDHADNSRARNANATAESLLRPSSREMNNEHNENRSAWFRK